MKHRILLSVTIMLLAVSLVFMGNSNLVQSANKIKVGFAQLGTTDAWRVAETKSMREEAAKRGYDLIITDAKDDTAKQVADVEDLIVQQVKYIFLAPREFEGLAPALQAAKEAKIPVFLIDRAAKGKAGEDYVTLISSDFILEGREAGKWLAKATKGKASIIHIGGTPGSSPARDRQKGFDDEVKKYPRMKQIAFQSADFVREKAQKVMENLIQSKKGKFNTVYCHSDEMALGCIQALKAAGLKPGKDIYVIGIDGQKTAVQAIIDGELSATVTCSPLFGPIAFDTLERYLKGEKLSEWIINPDRVIDKTNAQEFLPKAH